MDGTLLNSSGKVSPRNLAALKRAEAAGIEIVIATGRRHCYAMKVLRDLGLDPSSAMVTSNGTVLRTLDHQLLHRTHLSIPTSRWLCEHAGEFRSTLVFTFDKVDENGEDAPGSLVAERMDLLHASISRWMQVNEPYFLSVDRLEDALPEIDVEDDPESLLTHHPSAPIQAMMCGTIERMTAAEARLLEDPRVAGVGHDTHPEAEITLHRTIYPDRDLSIVDILPAGCSKASGLEVLARLRGIRMQDVMAIGDNWNDLAMLAAAGRPVLMSNAPEELLERAQRDGWLIVPSNDEDGVAEAIESALNESLTLTTTR
jgi:hydroxymethylpyrimidine pyrophosphatase-like HAD family hydrolase